MANWAGDEFGGANLGDGRLNARLIKLATRFAERPMASIPGACGDWAETQAAYRFFDQASAGKRGLNWQSILQPHMDCCTGRMAQHPALAVYLVVSWRLARLIRMGRIHPEWSADVFFSETEWAGAFILNKRKPPLTLPKCPPTAWNT